MREKPMNEVPHFIPVGELAEAFSAEANLLPSVADLAGQTLTLYFDDGRVIEHRFVDGTTLVWTVTVGNSAGESAEESYRATTPRPGIYLVDYVMSREQAMSVSLVLDRGQGIFTTVMAELPTREEAAMPFLDRIAAGLELTGVNATFQHGSIDTPYSLRTLRHEPTTELIGKRVEYTYSPTEQYEHVYMNRNFYAWQCLRGSEQGLSDADRCHYYKLGERFYLFVWREKIVPTLGLVLVDLNALRTTGKVLGFYGNDLNRPVNFPVGATARVVSTLERAL
jgi:hypothetical protein